ncbi:hypothetical protein SAMN05192589_107148 [Paracidovorax valerianellae]|uniref:Uncharacterized protein n=1 Tax=Paracidovorax valerianellae TaxID=187868 RepID=A0A1G6VVC5_9BURK|nr:hypothetical protein [Paracidovorax valerianellae]SDD57508.1 hypothetical protein SAMN05192589_107148 [Paracidovorax valerianellae]
MLIRLSEVRSVAARTISSIEVRTNHVAVQTDDGTCYSVGCDYGKSASATRDRLEAVINAALASRSEP